jgi:hypothetical protein
MDILEDGKTLIN